MGKKIKHAHGQKSIHPLPHFFDDRLARHVFFADPGNHPG